MNWTKERLFARCAPEPNSGCWLWMGALNLGGYGNIQSGDHRGGAHRAFYKVFKGEIPAGLDLDHKCRVRSCCNPDHLEPVTRSENLRRSPLMGRRIANLTHCKRGHELAGSNLRVDTTGRRICKTCKRWWQQKIYYKEI